MCPFSTLLRHFDQERIIEPVQGPCILESFGFWHGDDRRMVPRDEDQTRSERSTQKWQIAA